MHTQPCFKTSEFRKQITLHPHILHPKQLSIRHTHSESNAMTRTEVWASFKLYILNRWWLGGKRLVLVTDSSLKDNIK